MRHPPIIPAEDQPSPQPARRVATPIGLTQGHWALHLLGAAPESAVLVGDSPTDIEAARAAGVACIGYANKPEKRAALRDADAVINDMAILAQQLAQLPHVVEQ